MGKQDAVAAEELRVDDHVEAVETLISPLIEASEEELAEMERTAFLAALKDVYDDEEELRVDDDIEAVEISDESDSASIPDTNEDKPNYDNADSGISKLDAPAMGYDRQDDGSDKLDASGASASLRRWRRVAAPEVSLALFQGRWWHVVDLDNVYSLGPFVVVDREVLFDDGQCYKLEIKDGAATVEGWTCRCVSSNKDTIGWEKNINDVWQYCYWEKME